MIKTFSSVTPFLKLKPKHVSIENFAFKLHYRYTFIILVIATILVTSRQYIGEHIKCISDTIPEHVINTFCFFTPTFTVVSLNNQTALNNGIAIHPGVGPIGRDADGKEEAVLRHAYYQWVPFFLFGQALLFYIPHFMWKSMEGGRIFALVNGLKMVGISRYMAKGHIKIGDMDIPSREETNARIQTIKSTFINRLRINNNWGTKLVFCETLNLLIITAQIYYTNSFLNGQFYALGPNFIREDFTQDMDVLDITFPKVTKCHFSKYGASGSLQTHDTLCIMALNVINEKIYVMLWFWFLFVFVASVLALIWRAITIVCYKHRAFNNFVFGFACPGQLNSSDLYGVTRRCNFANWMFLYFLGSNMSGHLFKQVLQHLALEFGENRENQANDIRMSTISPEKAEGSSGMRYIDDVDGAAPLMAKEKVK